MNDVEKTICKYCRRNKKDVLFFEIPQACDFCMKELKLVAGLFKIDLLSHIGIYIKKNGFIIRDKTNGVKNSKSLRKFAQFNNLNYNTFKWSVRNLEKQKESDKNTNIYNLYDIKVTLELMNEFVTGLLLKASLDTIDVTSDIDPDD